MPLYYSISGTYKKKPPEPFKVELFQRHSRNTYRPRQTISVEKDGTWSADKIFSSKDTDSKFAAVIAIVGENGRKLVNYYERVGEENGVRPSIRDLTSDIYECDAVKLVAEGEKKIPKAIPTTRRKKRITAR